MTAVDDAKKALSPTSADEDAHMLAELIHSLGSQARGTRYEQIANGKADNDPLIRQVKREVKQSEGPSEIVVELVYVERDDGKAKNLDGEACVSIAQHISELEGHQKKLWEQAEKDGVTRQIEEKVLPEIQRKALERMIKQQENAAG